MFRWFETRLNPYPPEEPGQPPEGLFAFCWYYTRTAAPFFGDHVSDNGIDFSGRSLPFRVFGKYS